MNKSTKLALGAIGLGIVIFATLMATRPKAKKAQDKQSGLLVETRVFVPEDHDVMIEGQGNVEPAQEIKLVSEVMGKVVWQSPNLLPGGLVKAGDSLVAIEAKPYELMVKQQEANLERYRLELQIEEGRRTVAAREWKVLKKKKDSANARASLALREPQLRTAQLNYVAAQTALAKAQHDLAKTTLKAPFNAFVVQENSDIGQVVGMQTMVATLMGTDAYRVQVALPVERLQSIKVAKDTREKGSMVRIWQEVGAQRIERHGEVIQILGHVDPVGRMARVLVRIDNPLGDGKEQLPLLLGAYVHVEIAAKILKGVVALPRALVRDGNQVWLMNSKSTLEIRALNVLWRTQDSMVVKPFLQADESVITSRIPNPVPGMLLRVKQGKEKPGAREVQAALEAKDLP